MLGKYIFALCFFILSPALYAGDVEIEFVELKQRADKWDVHVRLRHDDTGWDHYADAWRIVDEEGKEIGKRVLYHPHVNEQPFTRSLRGVEIKDEDLIIFVEAHDKVHGWNKKRVRIHMGSAEGEKFRIITYRN